MNIPSHVRSLGITFSYPHDRGKLATTNFATAPCKRDRFRPFLICLCVSFRTRCNMLMKVSSIFGGSDKCVLHCL